MKTYSAQSGYVYQYYFLESKVRRRWLGNGGAAFLFHVTSDRKNFSVVEILLEEAALKAWEKAHGRALAEQEKYAAAKMGLFRTFDETGEPAKLQAFRVSAAMMDELLAPLGLDI